MLARASSDAGSRLHRSKSSSTVHRQPPPAPAPLDPETAHQHALAAATAAFSRVHAREVAERKLKQSVELSRAKSNASRKSQLSQGQGSHFPPHESSFRSMQQQKTGQGSRSKRRSRASTITTEKLLSFNDPINIDRPVTAPRPMSAQASVTLCDDARPNSQPKFGRMSASSSITSQQIRKARSMYYASSVQTGSPIARPPAKYLITPPAFTTPATDCTTNTKLTQALQPSPLVQPRIPVTIPDEDINKARDKYLQSFQQRSVKQKPSLFLAPFRKRQSKYSNKNDDETKAVITSSSSHQAPDDATVDFTLTDFLPSRERKEKRSLSGSLKSKFKRVFRRTSKEATHLPVQQIEASRDYFSTTHGGCSHVQDTESIPSPGNEMLERAHSRTPSLGSHPMSILRSQSRGSSNGSVCSNRSQRSLHSDTVATNLPVSRKNSWETMTTGTVLTQRAIKRLTVIHESKDSIGSEADRIASISMTRKSLPSTTLAAFREPMPMESFVEESSAPVDPKRVFSALMKEINAKADVMTIQKPDMTPGASSDIFESSKTKELHCTTTRNSRPGTADDNRPPSRRPPSAATHSVQSKTSSIRSLGRAIRSTIRAVTPGEHRSSPFAEATATKCRASLDLASDSRSLNTTAPSNASNISLHEDQYGEPTLANVLYSPPPEQIEKRVERAEERWKTQLGDVENLRFPRETDRTYDATNTSQSIALHTLPQSINRIPTVAQHSADSPALTSPTPARKPHLMSPLSPSVYSRNTDGMSILPNDSVLSLDSDHTASDTDGGSAIVVKSRSVRSYVVGTPSPRRPNSNRTSQDWRAWLSHEVSSIETTSQEDLQIDTHYLTRLHQREQGVAHTSQTDHSHPTVILRESADTAILALPPVGVFPGSVQPAGVFEKSESHPDTFKEVSPAHTLPKDDIIPPSRVSTTFASTSGSPAHRVFSTSSRTSSSSHPSLESTGSARMNDRFPYIDTGKRSSSGRTLTSGHSRSPGNSVASSNKSTRITPRSRMYSDLSAPTTDQTVVHRSDTATMLRDRSKSKENITPGSNQAGKGAEASSSSAIGSTIRRKSLQAVSPSTLNRSPNLCHGDVHVSELENAEHSSPSATTPARANVRATARPILRPKDNPRPKSAFDLRTSHPTLSHGPGKLKRTTIHSRPSTSASRPCKEPAPNADTRLTSVIYGYNDRSNPVSPGQRMADQFLKQRKSTGVLEGPRYRAGLRLVREDTPAFL